MRRVDAANDPGGTPEYLGDEPHSRRRLPHVEDYVSHRVFDGAAPKREGWHHQCPPRPDDVLQCPNGLEGATSETREPVEGAVYHQKIACDDAHSHERVLQIRRREGVERPNVGSKQELQPGFHANWQHLRGGGDKSFAEGPHHCSSTSSSHRVS